jgi:predicted Rossmann-fold nucleotide-binding protein
MSRIAVFASASDRVSTKKKKQAFGIGRLMGLFGHYLIYGAGNCGLMKELADGYLSGNPIAKPFGCTTHHISELESTASESDIHLIKSTTMHARKELYYLADIILVLSGGNGTGEELQEFITQKQLANLARSQGNKPETWDGRILLLKAGVWQSWIKLWEQMAEQHLAPPWQDMVELVDRNELELVLRGQEAGDLIKSAFDNRISQDKLASHAIGQKRAEGPDWTVWGFDQCTDCMDRYSTEGRVCSLCGQELSRSSGVWYCKKCTMF